MKRLIKCGIAGLLSASVGYVALAPGSAEAASCTITYSTGPLENEINKPADEVFVKILNNASSGKVEAKVKIFGLNGHKVLLDSEVEHVPAGASDFIVFDKIADEFQYEVQITLSGDAAKHTLVTVFPKDKSETLVAAQRVLHSELSVVKTTCSLW